MEQLTGHCLCGAVTVRVTDPSPEVGLCHCDACRRWTGAAYAAIDVPADRTTVDGPVRTYRHTPFSTRAFCEVCGSPVWLRDDDSDDIELMAGLFDGARDFALRSQVYADRQPAWLPIAGDHRRTTAAEYEAESRHV